MKTRSLSIVGFVAVLVVGCGGPLPGDEDEEGAELASAASAMVYSPQLMLRFAHSNKVMGVDGSNVEQETQNSWLSVDQRWWLIDLENGYYAVQNVDTDKCLDVDHSSTANGANVLQHNCIPQYGVSYNQQWRIEHNGAGYLLRARHSNKCLDVERSSTTSGANIIQYTCYYTGNQRVSFSAVGGMSYHPDI
jgi:hypothetical protein